MADPSTTTNPQYRKFVECGRLDEMKGVPRINWNPDAVEPKKADGEYKHDFQVTHNVADSMSGKGNLKEKMCRE